MRLYFLVEGEQAEMQIYPVWIKALAPSLKQYCDLDDFKHAPNGYFMISGFGYPSILNHLERSLTDIAEYGGADYFCIILDAEEESVQSRKSEINGILADLTLPEGLNIAVIVQNRCFETILLGNRSKIPRVNLAQPLKSYMDYYNVITDDPELMGCYTEGDNHAYFHGKYMKQAFKAKNIKYSKSKCRDVATENYLQGLLSRVETTDHLVAFKEFVDLMVAVEAKV
jgi:hypothetical protein